LYKTLQSELNKTRPDVFLMRGDFVIKKTLVLQKQTVVIAFLYHSLNYQQIITLILGFIWF